MTNDLVPEVDYQCAV